MPKSVSLAKPAPAAGSASTITLPGFTSRWITPRACACSSASHSAVPMRATSRSDSAPLATELLQRRPVHQLGDQVGVCSSSSRTRTGPRCPGGSAGPPPAPRARPAPARTSPRSRGTTLTATSRSQLLVARPPDDAEAAGADPALQAVAPEDQPARGGLDARGLRRATARHRALPLLSGRSQLVLHVLPVRGVCRPRRRRDNWTTGGAGHTPQPGSEEHILSFSRRTGPARSAALPPRGTPLRRPPADRPDPSDAGRSRSWARASRADPASCFCCAAAWTPARSAAFKDYVRDVRGARPTSRASQTEALFKLLSDPAAAQRRGPREPAQGSATRPSSSSTARERHRPPDELNGAHDYLVETLEFRRDGVGKIADILPTALRPRDGAGRPAARRPDGVLPDQRRDLRRARAAQHGSELREKETSTRSRCPRAASCRHRVAEPRRGRPAARRGGRRQRPLRRGGLTRPARQRPRHRHARRPAADRGRLGQRPARRGHSVRGPGGQPGRERRDRRAGEGHGRQGRRGDRARGDVDKIAAGETKTVEIPLTDRRRPARTCRSWSTSARSPARRRPTTTRAPTPRSSRD